MPTADERLVELLGLWQEGQQQGKPVSPEEICADCPELAGTLREHIALLCRLEGLAREDSGPDTPSPHDPGQATQPPAEGEGAEGERPPHLPGYEGLVWVGGGGMGCVYRARDTRLGRTVALKLVRPEQATPAMLDRLLAEARAVAGLDHPHIVKVFEVGQCQRDAGPAVPFIALEFVPGGSLEERLAGQALAADEAARLVMLLARAVQHAHERGVVHRDLKPANVLLAEPADVSALNTVLGCPKITDFGLARQVQAGQRPVGGGRLTATGVVMGTPAYMAPEQAEGRSDIGPPADVYALGVILYRVLAGRVPFESTSVYELLYRVCREAPPPLRQPLRQVYADVPEGLERLCLECLEKVPARRPTAAELARRLEAWGERPGASPSPEAWASPPAGRVRRWSRLVLGTAAAVLLLAGVGLAARALLWTRTPERLETVGGTEKGDKGDAASREAVAPLKVRPLRVLHFVPKGKKEELRGRIGEKSTDARYGDAVTLTVELSELGYFYLIGFNFDGKEQLMWPSDEKAKEEPDRVPPRLSRLHFPPGDIRWYLEDDPRGGLQVFVVAASRKPLPPYAKWQKQRGSVKWKRIEAEGVWEADDQGAYEVVPGFGADRGTPKQAPGTPPLVPRPGWIEGLEAGP